MNAIYVVLLYLEVSMIYFHNPSVSPCEQKCIYSLKPRFVYSLPLHTVFGDCFQSAGCVK